SGCKLVINVDTDEVKTIKDLKCFLSGIYCEDTDKMIFIHNEQASNDRIVCENQELRQKLNQMDISGSEEGSSDGKGSQNPMKRMTDILTQILNESQKTNSLMSGEKEKAFKTLEGIRQLVGNTDTESTASTTP
ncbi:unnamed protein product, partial [Oppiella nova]